MSKEPAPFLLQIDLSPFGVWLTPYVEELLGRLGPDADVPDDPLAALAQSHATPVDRPSDPVMARLLPDGVMEDEEAAAEFRRFSHATLRARKRRDAIYFRAVLTGGPAELTRWQTLSLLGALNDLRLMLGTSLMVSDNEEFEPQSPEDTATYEAYQMAALLQEVLLEALDASLD